MTMKLLKLWLPVFLWAWFIFYLSSIPYLGTYFGGHTDYIVRKACHITEYFILTFLLWRAFIGTFKLSPFSNSLWVGIISILYAFSDEVHQSFVPSRVCAAKDVLIDMAGITIFVILLRSKKLQGIFQKFS